MQTASALSIPSYTIHDELLFCYKSPLGSSEALMTVFRKPDNVGKLPCFEVMDTFLKTLFATDLYLGYFEFPSYEPFRGRVRVKFDEQDAPLAFLHSNDALVRGVSEGTYFWQVRKITKQ